MALAGLTPVPLEKFSGLDLVTDPEEIGTGAVDVLNIDFDQPGILRTRDGGQGFFTAPSAANRRYTFLHPHAGTSGLRGLIAGRLNDAGSAYIFELVDSTPNVTVTSAALPGQPMAGVDFGTPANSYSFFSFNGVFAIWRYDGTSFTAPAGPPAGKCVGVTPWDNRLVVANVAAGASRVTFSDAGDPTTFGANNYVDLEPGDGEEILGVQAWRDMLFVWKNTKGYVFYGTSLGPTLTPEFNYRRIATGIGLRRFQQGLDAGENGLYVLDPDRGVFVTTGGSPRLVSQQLTPIFDRRTTPLFPQGTMEKVNNTLWSFQAVGGKVYFTYTTSPSTVVGTLVYDEERGYWTFWQMLGNARAFCEWRGDGTGGKNTYVFYAQVTGTGDIARFKSSYNGDLPYSGGTESITARFRSGFLDLGSPGAEKVIRETQITGTGSVDFGWARDFGASPSLSTVTLGTSPATARGLNRVAVQGETLSCTLQSPSSGVGNWRVNRVVPMVRSVRGAGERTS